MSNKDRLMERLQSQVGVYTDVHGYRVEVLPPSRMSCSPDVSPLSTAITSEPAWNPAETYKRNDPRGWCGDPSRGAAMGRTPIKDIPEDYEASDFTIHVEHILLIEGYDPNGTYFGNSGPLFWVYAQAEVEKLATWLLHKPKYTELATLDYCERFVDLEDAVRIVKETWPHARVIGSEDWCDTLVEKYLDEEYEREQAEYRMDDEEAEVDDAEETEE